MDEPMKEIAWQAFANHDGGVERSMMAACDAVLAEAQRRENDPLAWKPCSHLPGYEQRRNERGNLETRPIAEPQRREAQPAPADDVVERNLRELVNEIWDGARESSGKIDAEAYASEIRAVAREGYVPASELEKAQEMGIVMSSQIGRYQLRIAELEQQLATMYTLEQVETAIRDEFNACSYATSYLEGESRAFGVNVRTRLARLARLAAPKPEPTEQEKVEAILLQKVTKDPQKAKEIAAEIVAEVRAALKGGK